MLRLSAVLAFLIAADVSAAAEPIRIVAFGDSATAGWLVARQDAYPAQLQASLRKKGYDVAVDNEGISGDTAPARSAASTARSRPAPRSRSSNSAPTTCAPAHR